MTSPGDPPPPWETPPDDEEVEPPPPPEDVPVLGVDWLLEVEGLLVAGELLTTDEGLLTPLDVEAGVPVLDPVLLEVCVTGFFLGLGRALSAGTAPADASWGIVAWAVEVEAEGVNWLTGAAGGLLFFSAEPRANIAPKAMTANTAAATAKRRCCGAMRGAAISLASGTNPTCCATLTTCTPRYSTNPCVTKGTCWVGGGQAPHDQPTSSGARPRSAGSASAGSPASARCSAS
jgi:hypothetical protein